MTAAEVRSRFEADLGFTLDSFQVEALEALDAGRNVLVAAPTSAGKTVVAAYAVARALAEGKRAFYTTPIKALSNQKRLELAEEHGGDRVGLLTGDVAVHGDAPIVVMTTEILRNMIYEGTPLDDLAVVVLDEVHYLQDPYRGPVWEEVVLHTPPATRLVCLSATVSNADELGAWIEAVRGPTAVVRTEHRPVPLRALYAVTDRFRHEVVLTPLWRGSAVSPVLTRLVDERSTRGGADRPRRGSRRAVAPRRLELLPELVAEGLTPAIWFVFSRAGCDDAVAACVDAGVRLTDDDQRHRIERIADDAVAGLADEDLAVLDYPRFRHALGLGLGAHHAGLVPPFKVAVEACFADGLLSVVFATETLALGVNLPARSVVIERLSKFDGERRRPLNAGEFTQLTGRAGRRGIDEVGHAVVAHSPWVPLETVSRLAASRSFPLASAFRPTYNMAANLVRRHDRDEALAVLNRSFGQFQRDREVVGLATQVRTLEQRLAEVREQATCERGNVFALAAARGRGRREERVPVTARDLARLSPGSVLELPGRRALGVVIAVAERRSGTVRLTVIARNGRRVQLTGTDFDSPPRVVGTVELPAPYQPTSKTFQREVGRALRQLDERALAAPAPTGERSGSPRPATGRAAAAEQAAVAGCPELDRHLAAIAALPRVERRLERARRGLGDATGALARDFEQVLALLTGRGYMAGWSLTDRGQRLAGLYHECDLLVCEALHDGLFDGLTPTQLATLVSCLTYERRSEEEAPSWFPDAELRRRAGRLAMLWARLEADERAAGLAATRPPDDGLVPTVHAWASGHDLGELLEETVAAGDLVRQLRQAIDLLRQLRDLAPEPATAAAAAAAAQLLDRGVVAAAR